MLPPRQHRHLMSLLSSLALFAAAAAVHRLFLSAREREVRRRYYDDDDDDDDDEDGGGGVARRGRTGVGRRSGRRRRRRAVSASSSSSSDADVTTDSSSPERGEEEDLRRSLQLIHRRRMRDRLSYGDLPKDHFSCPPPAAGGGGAPPPEPYRVEDREDLDRPERGGEATAGAAAAAAAAARRGRRRVSYAASDEEAAVAANRPALAPQPHPNHGYYYNRPAGRWWGDHFESYAEEELLSRLSRAPSPAPSSPPGGGGGGRGGGHAQHGRNVSWTTASARGASMMLYGGDEMDDDEAGAPPPPASPPPPSGAAASAAAAATGTAPPERTDGGGRDGGEAAAAAAAAAEGSRQSAASWGIGEGVLGAFFKQVSGISGSSLNRDADDDGDDDDGVSYVGEEGDAAAGIATLSHPVPSAAARAGAGAGAGAGAVGAGAGAASSSAPRSRPPLPDHSPVPHPRRCSSDPISRVSSMASLPGVGASANLDLEVARADYNARIMPDKVIMIRHGQSEGNVEEGLYATKPDNAMRLTELGWDQARMAGRVLRERALFGGGDGGVHFIVSPYVRTIETFHGLASAWCDPSEFRHVEDRRERLRAWYRRLMEMGVTWHEDPRIREQDFGNYQDPATIRKCKRERHRFGVFYYRFPHGESASDVFDRVSTFLDSLWRSFDLQRSKNYVLVTHGISIRVLLARYFRYSIDQFNMLANPKNCEMIILGHDGAGKLRLNGRCELELELGGGGEGEGKAAEGGAPKTRVVGYQFHERLRILPRKFIDKRTIRLSFDD